MGYENKVATLILKNVNKLQEGTYYCHATNIHGTTVLPSEVKVLPEESQIQLFIGKASDTIRLTLAQYNKREEGEQLVTNIFAYHKDEQFEEAIKLHAPDKASESAKIAVALQPSGAQIPPAEKAKPESVPMGIPILVHPAEESLPVQVHPAEVVSDMAKQPSPVVPITEEAHPATVKSVGETVPTILRETEVPTIAVRIEKEQH
ncbi:unnamed protein product, partial [Strongylus vulgaris]